VSRARPSFCPFLHFASGFPARALIFYLRIFVYRVKIQKNRMKRFQSSI
jgi:hypothetical protein